MFLRLLSNLLRVRFFGLLGDYLLLLAERAIFGEELIFFGLQAETTEGLLFLEAFLLLFRFYFLYHLSHVLLIR